MFNRKYFPIRIILYLNLFMLSFISCKTDNLITPKSQTKEPTEFWLTDASNNVKFTKQSGKVNLGYIDNSEYETIDINLNGTYQTMDGFGFALTGGSAYHIHNLPYDKKQRLLNELFDTTSTNIGLSHLRVSIGASDLDHSVFSYNDLGPNETDLELLNFSLEKDKEYLIPVIKNILEIVPNIKIMASPWSPPAWMKSNNSSIGGRLKSEYYDVYADYLIKYILSMKDEGIQIYSITVQNEPLHPHNNPSMLMLAEEQANFIKNHLGPKFEANNINTKIIIYDHNADRTDYPISILNDEIARQYIDGSAFHLYGGNISDLSLVHSAHPDKHIYFTEQWISSDGNFLDDLIWHTRNLLIGATRNWSKTIIEWNLASDENQDPHTEGGCEKCLGAITVSNNDYHKNTGFFIIAHISKHVRPGSKRVYSSSSPDLPNAAFLTVQNEIVCIVLNEKNYKVKFNLVSNNRSINAELPSKSVGTFIWDYSQTLD